MIAKGKIILLTVVLLGAGALAFALNIKTMFYHSDAPVKLKADKEIVYDTVVLKRFTTLLQTLDFNKSNFSYAGRFNITDGKDSLANVRDLPFLFCRAGKDFYSKVGNNEVVNEDGVNIYIENDNKKVVVSKAEFRLNVAMTNLKQVVEKARSEKYELVSLVNGRSGKLSLLNEHHVSCKELSVTYDTLTKKLNSVLLRYSDIADPLNKKRDRKVEIDVSQVEATARKHQGVKDIVKELEGKLTLLPKYSDYELITL
jgi:hypothetical protein